VLRSDVAAPGARVWLGVRSRSTGAVIIGLVLSVPALVFTGWLVLMLA
jgi:hypothetical protein